MTDEAQDRLSPLLSALDKLPPYAGLSYRGYVGRQGPGPRRTVVSGVLVATSLDPRVATENFTTDGLHAVIGRRGRDLSSLSQHPAEREVVFRPGSMFLPIERFDVDGLEVAVLEELHPDHVPDPPGEPTLEELKAAMTAAIRAARLRPDVEVAGPGKFTGPLA